MASKNGADPSATPKQRIIEVVSPQREATVLDITDDLFAEFGRIVSYGQKIVTPYCEIYPVQDGLADDYHGRFGMTKLRSTCTEEVSIFEAHLHRQKCLDADLTVEETFEVTSSTAAMCFTRFKPVSSFKDRRLTVPEDEGGLPVLTLDQPDDIVCFRLTEGTIFVVTAPHCLPFSAYGGAITRVTVNHPLDTDDKETTFYHLRHPVKINGLIGQTKPNTTS